jgi:hypothetical protein
VTDTEKTLVSNLGAPVVPLASICEQYFGLSPKAAQEHAALNKLPVPTFRLRESQKAPLMVHVRDLAQHIDDAHVGAKEHWEHSQV